MEGLIEYPFLKLFFVAWIVGLAFRLGWRFADAIGLAVTEFREGFSKAFSEKRR